MLFQVAVQFMIDRVSDDVILGGKIIVKGAFGHAAGRADIVDGNMLDAVSHKKCKGGFGQLGPGPGRLQFPGCRRKGHCSTCLIVCSYILLYTFHKTCQISCQIRLSDQLSDQVVRSVVRSGRQISCHQAVRSCQKWLRSD